MLGILKRFKEFGLVGINKRNAGYTLSLRPNNWLWMLAWPFLSYMA